MRGVTPIELTCNYRNFDKGIDIDTYEKARANRMELQTWLNPMLNCFNGIVMEDLQHLLKWTNCNIFLKIDINSFKTTGVLIRIATGMLNNIEYLTKHQKQQLHLNLIQSVKWLQAEYIVANLKNDPDDLPF